MSSKKQMSNGTSRQSKQSNGHAHPKSPMHIDRYHSQNQSRPPDENEYVEDKQYINPRQRIQRSPSYDSDSRGGVISNRHHHQSQHRTYPIEIPRDNRYGANGQSQQPHRNRRVNYPPVEAPWGTWDEGAVDKEIKTIYLAREPHVGLGLSIRGGAEHGIGIYVSGVEVNSLAERQGLSQGDHILSVNGVSFTRIPHSQAAEMIRVCEQLDMEVCSVGRIPGSYESHQIYSWVDLGGRLVSPPPEVDRMGRYDLSSRGTMLLKDPDERKVNVILHDGARLGFLLRGGREFGLGIYITGVDRGSLAESGGIKPGDQILDVNGNSFLDIKHSEAVKILKSSRHLVLTVKDVRKIPHTKSACESWDNTPPQGYHPVGFVSAPEQSGPWATIHDYASQVLLPHERELLVYYLKGYEIRQVTIDALCQALTDVLDTAEKAGIMGVIRGLIRIEDIKVFENIVFNKDNHQSPGTSGRTYRSQATADRGEGNGRKSSRSIRNPKLDELRSPSDDSGVDVNNGWHAENHLREPYNDFGDPTYAPGHQKLGHRRSNPESTQQIIYKDEEIRRNSASYNTRENRNSEQGYEPTGTMWRDQTQIDSYEPDRRHTADSYHNAELDVYNHSKNPAPQPDDRPVRPARKKAHFKTQHRSSLHRTESVSADSNQLYLPESHNSRPGILKNNNNQHSQRNKQERVPCIKIENWEDMKQKLEKDMPELKKNPSVQKKEGRQYRQKFRLTPEEMTLVKNRVKEKLEEIDRKKRLRNMSPGKDDNSSSSFTVKTHKLVKPKSVDEMLTAGTSGDGTDAHIYSDMNWDAKRAEIIKRRSENTSKVPSSCSADSSDSLPYDYLSGNSSLQRTQLKKISVYKSQATLGLSIEGGANTKQPLPRIINIKDNGCACKSDLMRGQLILEVNGKSLRELSHKQCAQAIADAFKAPSTTIEFLVVDKSSSSQQEQTDL